MVATHICIWLTLALSFWGVTKTNDGGRLHQFLWIVFQLSMIGALFSVYAIGIKFIAFLAGF